MFVGRTTNGGHDFYVRQLRDGKVIPKGETITGRLAKFAAACGRALARAQRAAVTRRNQPLPRLQRQVEQLSWLSRRPTPTRMNETTRSSPGQPSRVRSRVRSAGPSVGDYGPTPLRCGSVCALVIGKELAHVDEPVLTPCHESPKPKDKRQRAQAAHHRADDGSSSSMSCCRGVP